MTTATATSTNPGASVRVESQLFGTSGSEHVGSVFTNGVGTFATLWPELGEDTLDLKAGNRAHE